MALANSSQCGKMAASLASLEALVWFSVVSFLKYCGGRKSLVLVGTVSCGIVICCRQGEIEPYGHVCIVFFNWMFLASISKLSCCIGQRMIAALLMGRGIVSVKE